MSFTPEQRAKALETNRRKAQERRERMTAAGIPDSKPFGGVDKDPWGGLAGLHVGGVPVEELPIEMAHRLTREHTDEGIEERNAGKSEHRIEVTRDEFSGKCLERKDAIINDGMQPWEVPDALKEVADAHARPGFRPKFLSPAVIDQRGWRGYEPVKDKNGSNVQVRNMILGQIPEEKAEARNKHFRDIGNKQVKEAEKQYKREGGTSAVGSIEGA